MTQAIVPKELLTATPGGLSLLVVSGGVDGQVLTQQADGTYAPEAVSAGIGGSVGSTDNRLVRSDGTGGSTVQSTGLTVDDSNNLTGVVAITASGNADFQTASNSSTAFRVRNAAGMAVLQVDTSNRVFIAGGDSFAVRVGTGGTYVFNGGFFAVTNSTDASSAIADTFLSRYAAGIWRMGTASNNALGSLLLADITASGLICCGVYTFATVPSASSNTGKFLRISDRAQKHAYSDGTNWRFFGDDAIIS